MCIILFELLPQVIRIQMAFNLSLMIILLTLHCCGFCIAEFVRNGTHLCALGNCIKVDNCIDNYRELDLYVRGNGNLREKLTSAFFVTGEIPSDFVKITYNFQISNSMLNGTSNSTKDNCSNHQSTYIWSDNFLYILGRGVLFWFTLSVVEVREGSVTIDLPCLCHDDYSSLLSRLTYMV